jgi:DNA-binding transcriptional LysR family regulator
MVPMAPKSLAQIDANLLVALDALLAEQSVTKAARRLHVTQSAMSQSLARLRDVFEDALLVRKGERMVPTPLAAGLAEPLARALRDLEHVLQTRMEFQPARDSRRFTVATTDYLGSVLFSQVVAAARRDAPGVDFDFRPFEFPRFAEALERGELDLAVGVFEHAPGTETLTLFREGFALLARRGHPYVQGPHTVERFAAFPQVLMAVGGSGPGVVDVALAQRGLSRRVAARVPAFTMGAALVAGSDLLMTLPRRFGAPLARAFDLEVLPVPLPLEDFTVKCAWHARTRDEPAHQWLREQVHAAARRL